MSVRIDSHPEHTIGHLYMACPLAETVTPEGTTKQWQLMGPVQPVLCTWLPHGTCTLWANTRPALWSLHSQSWRPTHHSAQFGVHRAGFQSLSSAPGPGREVEKETSPRPPRAHYIPWCQGSSVSHSPPRRKTRLVQWPTLFTLGNKDAATDVSQWGGGGTQWVSYADL